MDPQEPMRVGFFRYFLFHDPNWDYRSIDWERDLAYAEATVPFVAAVEYDLNERVVAQSRMTHSVISGGSEYE
jgi:hypothetical protein